MKIIRFLTHFLMLQFACAQSLTYNLEILQSPVGLTAINKVGGYTELTFYAQNIEADFDGYKVTTGATQAEATASTTYYDCLFTTPNSAALNKPLKAQLGSSGADCSNTTIGPLATNTWVAIRSHGSRDCTKYGFATKAECAFSDPAVSKVIADITPAPVINSMQLVTSPDSHYELNVTMGAPANLTGLGLFYSIDPDEANGKAISDVTLYDGFCSFPAGGTVVIQIGGTNIGLNCYVANFYLVSGETIAIRNAITSTDFPWSDSASTTVP